MLGLRRCLGLGGCLLKNNLKPVQLARMASGEVKMPTDADWDRIPEEWLEHNKKVYPPQKEGEPRRPAFICHYRANIRYSWRKMWYVARVIRGLSVDEAIKQLLFLPVKGAKDAIETIQEAQEIAVKQHNVEYKSNLWVAESYALKGLIIKGVRRHARLRLGEVRWNHCDYFVRLEEGPAPEHYYSPPWTGYEKLEDYLAHKRGRVIEKSL